MLFFTFVWLLAADDDESHAVEWCNGLPQDNKQIPKLKLLSLLPFIFYPSY